MAVQSASGVSAPEDQPEPSVDGGSFASRVMLVTGAGSGIGAATARALLARGVRLIAVDRSSDRLNEVFASGELDDAVTVEADVSTEAGAEQMVETCRNRFGQLHGVVANAGISLGGTVETMQPDEWDRLIEGNLRSVYLTARFSIPLMRETGGGSFVAVASQMGIVGTQDAAAYCASKGGVISLARAMALDHARDDIRVNSVCPGPTSTPMFRAVVRTEQEHQEVAARVPLGRTAEADEIAAVIVFLLSDAASFVTGASWLVDGGYAAA